MTQTGDMGYRAPVFVAVVAASVFSMVVFMGSDWGASLGSAFDKATARVGLGIGIDAFVALALALSVVAAIPVEKRILWPIRISWFLFLPSTLFYSGVDLANLFGRSIDYSVFANSYPDAAVMLNGVVLMAATLLARSYLGVSEIRRNLLRRGADRGEADSVCSRNMGFLVPLIAGPCALAAFLWYASGEIASWTFMAGIVETDAYLWVSVAAVIALFVIFVYSFLGRGKPGKAGG